MTIPSKEEKVKEELHRGLGEGRWIGAYNRNSFLLTYLWDITKKASKSGVGGGGGMCQSTLNWVYKL